MVVPFPCMLPSAICRWGRFCRLENVRQHIQDYNRAPRRGGVVIASSGAQLNNIILDFNASSPITHRLSFAQRPADFDSPNAVMINLVFWRFPMDAKIGVVRAFSP